MCEKPGKMYISDFRDRMGGGVYQFKGMIMKMLNCI